MNVLEGRYFFPHSSRTVPSTARLGEGNFIITGEGAVLDEAPFAKVDVSSRLGTLSRKFTLPGGGCFEATSNDAAEDFLRGASSFRGRGWIHALENSWRWAALALLVSAASMALFVIYGIPAGANYLAQATPHGVDGTISRETLRTLDRIALSPTKLTQDEQARAQGIFSGAAVHGARGAGAYRLLFRAAPHVGPNAFALPDGTVVMTDELWKLVKDDGEIAGVFAHEMTHVDKRHGLQIIYQAAFVPAIIALITGDISQVGQLAVVLPGMLMQASYSQRLEQEADDNAAHILRRMRIAPSHLADLLERMSAEACGKNGCAPTWLGSHPETTARAMRLRQE